MAGEFDTNYVVRILLEARDTASASVAALRGEIERLKAEAAGGHATADLTRGFEDVGRSAEQAARGQELHARAAEQDARASSTSSRAHRDVSSAMSERERARQRLTNAERDALAAHRDAERTDQALQRRVDELSNSYNNFDGLVRRGTVSVEEQRRSYGAFATELQTIARRLGPVGNEFQRVSRLAEDARRNARVGMGIDPNAVRDLENFAQRVERVGTAYEQFNRRVRTGSLSESTVRRGYQDFARDLSAIARGFEAGTAEAERFGVMADRAAGKAKNAAREAAGGWKNPFDNLAAWADNFGIQIISLSASLRGLLLVGAVGFAQQLDTALVALAGSFFAVGSAAAEAGAALGGAFVAGIAQAMPVVTVFLAAVQRIQAVFQAAQLSTQAQQQQALNPTQHQQAQLENANQMQSAQNALADSYLNLYNAQEQVRTSQEALTQSRIDAIRNITDLTMAERNAALQQVGAHLTLDQAQQQLQADIAKGTTGVALEQAQLGVQEARLGATQADIQQPRSVADAMRARRRGVNDAPQVRAAMQAERQAREQVIRARQAIGSAQRGETLAGLRASAPSFGLSGPQAQLNYLVGQMSGPEKALFGALTGIERQLRSPNSPLRRISDAIVTPIADAFQTLDKILRNPDAMRSLQKLADAIGRGMGTLEKAFLGPRGQSFFNEMARDAAQNAPIIFQILDRLVTIFEDIAKAASPVLRDILKAIDDFLGGITQKLNDPGGGRSGTPSGLDKLSAFFMNAEGYLRTISDFIGAFGKLMMALGGDAAPAGKSLLDDMTNRLNDWTDWVDNHGPQVRKFFDDAIKAVEQVGRIVAAVAGGMMRLFDLGAMKTFAQFLSQIFFPAVADVLKVIGAFVQAFMNFFNLFGAPGRTAMEVLGVIVIGLIGFGKVYEPVMKAYKAIKALSIALETFKITGSLGAAVNVFKGYMAEMETAANTTKTAIEEERAVAGEGAAVNAESAAAGTAASTAGGGATAAEGATAGTALGRVLTFAARVAPWAIAADALINADSAGQTPQAEQRGLNQIRRRNPKYGTLQGMTPQQLSDATNATTDTVQAQTSQLAQITRQINSLGANAPDWITKRLEDQRTYLQKSLQDWHNYLNQINAEQINRHFGPVGMIIANTFKQISTSSAILPQVEQLVSQNMQRIASDMGTNSARGRFAIEQNFGGAIKAISTAMHEGLVSTSKGSQAIIKELNKALKLLGARPLSLSNLLADAGPNSVTVPDLASQVGGAYSYGGGNARGGWVPASQGGMPYRVGEGGYKEMVLTTDPQQAPRSRDLLGEYLRNAPHMASGGFVALPGTNFSVGQEPQIAADLRRLAAVMHATIYGISGYRTPQHSVSVGGFANDPHTRGQAADIGINSASLASAAMLNDAVLRSVGLYRPFYPADPHEINHVQLLAGGATGSIPAGAATAAAIQRLMAPHATDVSGGMRPLVQGVLNRATAAANAYLQSQPGTGGPTASAASVPGGAGGGYGGGGLANVPSALEAFNHVYPLHHTGTPGTSLPSSVISRIQRWAGLPLPSYISQRESSNMPGIVEWPPERDGAQGYGLWQLTTGHVDPAVVSLIMRLGGWGQMLNPLKNAMAAAKLYDIGGPGRWATYDVGGMVAPWGGRPVPIVAHEGERVVNPPQWGALAALAGTNARGLDSYMGYDGKPRQHFQDGGSIAWSPSHPFLSAALPNLPGLTSLNPAIESVVSVLNAVVKGFTQLNQKAGRGSMFDTTFIKFVDSLTNETSGLIPALTNNFASFQQDVAHRIARITYSRTRNPFAPSGTRLGRDNTGVMLNDPIATDQATLGGYQDQQTYLSGEQTIIGDTLKSVNKRVADAQKDYKKHPSKANKAKLQRLQGQQQNLLGARRNVRGSIDDNTGAIYQAQQQLLQDQLSGVNNQFGTEQANLQANAAGTGQSQLQALGNFGALAGPDAQMTASLRRQVTAMQPLLDRARAMGDKDMSAQIEQQMAQLQGQITSAVVQQISDAQQAVGQSAGNFQAGQALLSTRAGIATANNNFSQAGALNAQVLSNSLDANQEGSLQWQLGKYTDLLAQAQAAGDTGAVSTLTQTIDQLTGEIATNNQALKDNTAQVVAQTASYIQGRAQFATGAYSGLAGIITTIGQITGNTDTGALIGLAQNSNTTLSGANQQLISGSNGLDSFLQGLGLGPSGLAGLSGTALVSALSGMNFSGLESHMDATQQSTFETLIGTIISNTGAIETNNQQISTLNGQLRGPQSWSTTSWSAFRMAIFNGMGGLLPQYSSVLAPGDVPQTPVYGSASPMPSGTPTIGELHLTHPVETLDPGVLGQQLHYALANAPTS